MMERTGVLTQYYTVLLQEGNSSSISIGDFLGLFDNTQTDTF